MDIRIAELEFLSLLNREGPQVEVSWTTHDKLGLSDDAFKALVLAMFCNDCVTGEDPSAPVSRLSNALSESPRTHLWRASERSLHQLLGGKYPYYVRLTHEGRLRMARLRDELDRGRITDQTGILVDGRFLDRDLRVRTAMAAPTDVLSIVMADLDHFKKLNDRCGHDLGDEALRRYFSILRDLVSGEGGDAYRRGGDETLAILVGPVPDKARELAEGIRRGVSKELEEFRKPGGSRLTVSVGLLMFQARKAPPDIRTRVDRLLYRAKEEGRDRVVGEIIE